MEFFQILEALSPTVEPPGIQVHKAIFEQPITNL